MTVDIDKAQTELKAAKPSKPRLLKWLGDIGTMVQTVASAQPALEAVRAAGRALGLPL